MASKAALRSKTVRLSLARYRLRFLHPFGTAHGIRDGTDSVFVRLEQEGLEGFGEATLPPYLPFYQKGVWDALVEHWAEHGTKYSAEGGFPACANTLPPPARAALQVAHRSLYYSKLECSDQSESLGRAATGIGPPAMATLGLMGIDDIVMRVKQLPGSTYIKLKLGGPDDLKVLRTILDADPRGIFLDGNQAWRDLKEAASLLDAVDLERIVGLEQPFAKERLDLHQTLRGRYPVPIYGDESVQGPGDLAGAAQAFDGVNLKLMKCGGLDVAEAMIGQCKELGLKVLLGCMSESSLGCAAMASLQHLAELVDLDGPWLIGNDPFQGTAIMDGRLVLEDAAFPGVRIRRPSPLEFMTIGT